MAYPKLFLAHQCPHSHQLWKKYTRQLSECAAIYVYSRKDGNARRAKETKAAITQYGIRQFPTLIFADGTRLETSRQIEEDLNESLQIINDKPLIPRYQDQPVEQQQTRPSSQGFDANANIDLHDRTIQQSMIGDWPKQGEVQQQQQYPQQGFTQESSYTDPHQSYQQQQPPQDGHLKAFNALGSNLPATGSKCEGIGTSADVDTSAAGAGSSTSMMPTNVSFNDEEGEAIGDWPTSRKVNGLTGRGQQNIDTFHAGRASQHQNMQNMNMQFGQVVADPVPGF